MDDEKRFDALAWWLHKLGVRPDHLTYLQAPVYAGMVLVGYRAAAEAAYLWAFAALQILVVILDGADGIMARRTGTATRRGHLLDSTFDVTGIGITLWVAFHLHAELAGWLLLLMFVNFLVYMQNEIQGTKSITYTRGPVTIGLILEQWYPGLLLMGILLPLAIGLALMATRVAWRKRLWNYYQFFTAGRRREYKAVPRAERAQLLPQGRPLGLSPVERSSRVPADRAGVPKRSEESEESSQARPR